MKSQQRVSTPSPPSPHQKSVRRRTSGLHLRGAVRLAVHAFFHFTHRSREAKALWSRSERVWLGNRTFLDWAMRDGTIDLPWLVADAADAPETADELREAVHAELVAYWAEQLAALPRKSTPHWPPLP